MEIIKQWDEKKEGNDCMIKTNICMMECDCRYFIITVRSMCGWFGTETTRYMEMFESFSEAEEYYKKECQ